MIEFGRFQIWTHNFGYFRLDGGSMFGSVPKNLWSRRIAADDENCIRLATRSLLVRDGSRLFLVDTGMGGKWAEKEKRIFGIEPDADALPSFVPHEVTDLVLTHLHFDHAGGVSQFSKDGSLLELVYKNATVHLQHDNLTNARAPTIKERASYLPENIKPLEAARLNLVRGSCELHPGIWVHQVDGHTVGQQWVEIRNGGLSIVFPTDLIPTSHHLPLPFHMGYDICAGTLLKEKEDFLTRAVEKEWIVVFQHDASCPAGLIGLDAKGHFTLRQSVAI